MRAARTAILLTIVALGCLVASPALARRQAPFGLFGTVLDPAQTDPANVSDATLDQQMGLMARSGVESLRVTFNWNAIEPAQGTFDWSSPDRVVADAARHGLSLLPDLIYTPAWASSRPLSPVADRYGPSNERFFAGFATAVSQRYGPHGTFWKLNPGLPHNHPVRQWQIWNEEAFNVFWASFPWPQTYTALLRAGYQALHAVDHGATVVAGSLAAVGNINQWTEMRDLYRAGAGHYFDEISVHPFTIDPRSVSNSVLRMALIVSKVRGVMRSHGQGAKPIILTELSWPGAVGKVAKSRLLGLETTPAGERRRMTAAYSYLVSHRRRTGVTQAYWYAWATTFNPNDPQSDVSFDFAGLTRFVGGSFVTEPALSAYRGVATRYEGCRKTSDARRCR